MVKINPKRLNRKEVDWQISERSRNILKHFSEFSEHTEEDIVEILLNSLMEDEDFLKWAYEKRNNKRMLNELGLK